MKKQIMSILCITTLVLSGCGGREGAAKKLYGEGLKIEQKDSDQAAKIYLQVIDTYPDTTAATSARQRIDVLKADLQNRANALLN